MMVLTMETTVRDGVGMMPTVVVVTVTARGLVG
jgi:hypothetical protein